MAMQQRLLDPYEGDPHAERARSSRRPGLEEAKQLVLDLLVSGGGAMEDVVVMEAAGDRGLAADELSLAVGALEEDGTVVAEDGTVRLSRAA